MVVVLVVVVIVLVVLVVVLVVVVIGNVLVVVLVGKVLWTFCLHTYAYRSFNKILYIHALQRELHERTFKLPRILLPMPLFIGCLAPFTVKSSWMIAVPLRSSWPAPLGRHCFRRLRCSGSCC